MAEAAESKALHFRYGSVQWNCTCHARSCAKRRACWASTEWNAPIVIILTPGSAFRVTLAGMVGGNGGWGAGRSALAWRGEWTAGTARVGQQFFSAPPLPDENFSG